MRKCLRSARHLRSQGRKQRRPLLTPGVILVSQGNQDENQCRSAPRAVPIHSLGSDSLRVRAAFATFLVAVIATRYATNSQIIQVARFYVASVNSEFANHALQLPASRDDSRFSRGHPIFCVNHFPREWE